MLVDGMPYVLGEEEPAFCFYFSGVVEVRVMVAVMKNKANSLDGVCVDVLDLEVWGKLFLDCYCEACA